MIRSFMNPASFAVVASLAALFAASPRPSDDPGRQTLLTMLVVADLIEAHADPASGILEATRGIVPVDSLRRRVRPEAARYFVGKDRWGRDLLYWSDGWNYMILSLGSDGIPDVDYAAASPPYQGALVGLTTDPTQDIIVVNGTIQRGPFATRHAPANSLAALRSIATACEEYAIDHNFYPNSGAPLAPVSAIKPVLVPVYIRALPERDGWGHSILYWTNIADYPYPVRYGVISTGADGLADSPYEAWTEGDFLQNAAGPVTDLRRDTILLNGQIIQYQQLFSSPSDRTRMTMATLRSIGTAVEMYSIDNNFYPNSGGSITSVSSLASLLSPTYIQMLPSRDGWGETILYWSDRTQYWVVSAGSDRSPDHPYDTWQAGDFRAYPGGPTTSFERDIIFSNGQFLQYPDFNLGPP